MRQLPLKRNLVFSFMPWAACVLLCGVGARPALGQLATSDHVELPGFWPTKPTASRSEYVGAKVCAECHESIAQSSGQTPMAHAAMLATESSVLQSASKLHFTAGAYQYSILPPPHDVSSPTASGSSAAIYRVTDGKQTLQYPLLWAFGSPRVGQSYLFRKPGDSTLYEARTTYFTPLHNLNFTPARALTSPADLEEAMDRPVPEFEVVRCFSCHTTAAVFRGTVDELHLIPGVSCEACHGPGARHVTAMRRLLDGKSTSQVMHIFNPATLSPADSVDFCGACHETWWDVKTEGDHGPSTARMPAYRLESSQCWLKTGGDARLTCMTCHDPHVPLQTNPLAYDARCLACHAIGGGTPPKNAALQGAAASCPVGTQRCTTCHMPKVFVPEMQDTFTDHRIRIAKQGEPYPE